MMGFEKKIISSNKTISKHLPMLLIILMEIAHQSNPLWQRQPPNQLRAKLTQMIFRAKWWRARTILPVFQGD